MEAIVGRGEPAASRRPSRIIEWHADGTFCAPWPWARFKQWQMPSWARVGRNTSEVETPSSSASGPAGSSREFLGRHDVRGMATSMRRGFVTAAYVIKR